MKCGSCKGRHDYVAEVRDCYAQAQYDEEQAKAELLAEQRAERFWEEGTDAQHARYRHEVEEDERRNPFDPQLDLIGALEDSVREVRYINEQEAERAARVLDDMTGSPGRDMASQSQVRYVLDLLSQREWPDTISQSDVENMERRQVSKLIDQLKLAPFKSGAVRGVLAANDYKAIPAGRYALVEDNDGVVRFYEVSIPKSSSMWAGRIFVAQLYGSPGEYRKEPRRGAAAKSILDDIAQDVEGAMALFGKESGYCGKCHSPLTNPESLARGIGPVCVRKMGW